MEYEGWRYVGINKEVRALDTRVHENIPPRLTPPHRRISECTYVKDPETIHIHIHLFVRDFLFAPQAPSGGSKPRNPYIRPPRPPRPSWPANVKVLTWPPGRLPSMSK